MSRPALAGQQELKGDGNQMQTGLEYAGNEAEKILLIKETHKTTVP